MHFSQNIFTRRIKFSGGGDFPSQVADLPTSPILTLLVLLRRLSLLPCRSLIRSSRLLDLGNEERGGADDGLPLPDDLQVDQVQSERRQRNQLERAQDQHEVSIFPDLDFPRRETVEVFALIVKRHRLNTTMIR